MLLVPSIIALNVCVNLLHPFLVESQITTEKNRIVTFPETAALTSTDFFEVTDNPETWSQERVHENTTGEELDPFNTTDTVILTDSSNSVVDSNTSTDDQHGISYSSSSTLTLKLLYLITGVFGILGNSLTSFVMLYDTKLRSKVTNNFMVNQSLIDLFAALLMVIVQYTDDITWVPDGLAVLIFCRLWLSKTLLWGAFFTSTFNLVTMTWERYFAIVHALAYNRYFTKRRARVLMVLIWIAGQSWGSYCLFSTNIVDGECKAWQVWPSREFGRTFGFVIVSMQYFIPILMLMFAYGNIIVVLNRKATSDVMKSSTETKSKSKSKPGNDHREAMMIRARRNVVKTLIIVGVCFIICWGPNQIMYFINNLGVSLDYTKWYFHLSVMMASANCCINPIIYTANYEQFQQCLKKLFCKKHKHENRQNTTRSFSDFRSSESVDAKIPNV